MARLGRDGDKDLGQAEPHVAILRSNLSDPSEPASRNGRRWTLDGSRKQSFLLTPPMIEQGKTLHCSWAYETYHLRFLGAVDERPFDPHSRVE